MDLDKRYIFNPYYILKPDKKRVILTESGSYFTIPSKLAEDSFYSFVHPVFGVILSFFDGRSTLRQTMRNICNHFRTTESRVHHIVSRLVDNSEKTGFIVQGHLSEFPKFSIVEYKDTYNFGNYKPEIFEDIKNLDFSTERLFEGPLDITILVNTICGTDCEYCYVDRSIRQNCRIPLPRLLEIIDEAKGLGVRKVDIAGAEIFLYKHWDILVQKLIDSGYYPYLSTKIPLSIDQIRRLKDIGIRHLQVSVDSLDPQIVSRMWNVRGERYCLNLFQSLKNISRQNLKLQVNTVLTKTNASVKNLTDLLLKLKEISTLKKVVINEAGPSTAKTEGQFKRFRLTEQQTHHIKEVIKKFNQNGTFQFATSFSQGFQKKDFVAPYSEKKQTFSKRAACPAGLRSFTILCDGQVTICEELYWTKQFIIGNIKSQSIQEIWNSNKATRFSKFTPTDFLNNSLCGTCNIFNKCRAKGIGVCWSKVVQAYGNKYWRYPDPACPKAPEPYYEIYSG